MTKTSRARYTLEFKQEAVRLVENGQSTAAVALTLGVVNQTLFNWAKAHRQGKLTGADSKPVITKTFPDGTGRRSLDDCPRPLNANESAVELC